MEANDFRFWHTLPVRYRDVDRQDIVYFGVYLEYFSTAIHEYFRALDIRLAETEPSGEFDTVFVRVEVDYLGSARLDDLINVGVRAERIGTSSLEFASEARNGETGAVLCRGRLVMVNIHRHASRSKPIPAWIRSAVATFEGLAT